MKPTDTRLGPGAEFDLVRRLRARWADLAAGIGDDAAVLRAPRGEKLVLTTDASIEDVHFRNDWLGWGDIGYRAVTAAISDLAAMAAAPSAVLVSIALSPAALDAIDQLADGIGDAARASGALIVGGNIAHAAATSITTTAVGATYTPLERSGARPGDLLYVTGALGGPAAAIRAWRQNRQPAPELRARFARPTARVREARWLASRGAVAAIDISDGFAADIGHLAAASDVAIEVQVERIPVFAGATETDALGGGEEYELAVFARAPLPEAEFTARFGIPLTLVGRAVEGGTDVRLTRDDERVATPKGYDHLSR